MKVYTIKDILKGLKQDEMTEYLERFQFNDVPVWIEWLMSSNVYHYTFESSKDSREFEDNISVIGIPLIIVDKLSHIDSLRFINNTPTILENTRLENEETINKLENEIWGLSYRYSQEGFGKNDIYVFWIWSNGYLQGIYKGKTSNII